jgi:type IV secretory pathway VirB6-like protein
MGANVFEFIKQAITDLLTSKLGFLQASGLNLFRGLALIMVAWFGVKAALSSAQGGEGFNFAKFADLLLMIAFGFAMLTYYTNPLPGMNNSFAELVTNEATYLSAQIGGNQAEMITTAISTAEQQLGSPPGVFSFHEELTYFFVYTVLAVTEGLALAVIAYGFVATAVCVLLGPIFIPFFIVGKLDWLFWGWFRAFLGFAFYQVVANAFIYIIAKVLLGLLGVIGPVSISNAYVLMPALIVTLAVCAYGLFKIPELTSAIISGRVGLSASPVS